MSRGLQLFLYGSIALSGAVEARFNQENAVQGVISSIGGGEAATLAGASIRALLAGANACDKLTLADQVAALGGDADGALDAAKQLVQAEKNFNPFAVDRPSVCDDPSLPANEGLRGIVPLIDPAVDGAAAVNDASAASLTTPVNQAGSQADLLRDIGFETFTAQSGGSAAPPADEEAGSEAGNKDNAEEDAGNEVNQPPIVNASCPAVPPANNDNIQDIQSFTGSLGKAIEPIEFSGDDARPFLVGGSTFGNFAAAAARSCDRQFNGCANVANAGGADFTVADCSAQKDQCTAAQSTAPVQSFARRRRRSQHKHKRSQNKHHVKL
ncbi:uncharacterized protein J7T54_002481 [Emericellopsis cladophorae]|uniref:Uncharacterized protein n=1 Tax=Emericellopsis cladophorae TaxID=2686198 RepID=A0A9P9Y107_9HYPO|nr:uncharacterized protein J7T54_002481 [Emericellopsis cladophorae]KAI6781125.1 hypothetical protein J7T54_002481 [Emericellopsis cladophorae]